VKIKDDLCFQILLIIGVEVGLFENVKWLHFYEPQFTV